MNSFDSSELLATPKVLIIDDVPANLKVLLASLSDEYDIIMATSGEQGLKLAASTKPDVIMLDISMPGMDGHEVCRQLKSNKELRDIPVVFSTALADPANEAKGLLLGAADFINKPFRIEVVKLRLRNIIDGQRLRKLIENKNLELQVSATSDPLTKLPNRATLDDRLEVAVSLARRNRLPLALLFIDLDGFKLINDQHGHAAGDQLLVRLSQRIQDCLREGDTVARFGGDEFVVIINNLEGETAVLPMLERLLQVLAKPVMYADTSLQVSASIGVRMITSAFSREPHVKVDQALLIKQADEAMYAAKKAGKNQYAFFGQAPLELLGNPIGNEEIAQALREDQFELLYCPMADAQTGEIVALEALLRWRHPELGLLSPRVFLLGLEKHPLSVEVGQWVLQNAIKQISQWRAKGFKVAGNINIGAYHFSRAGFGAGLRKILNDGPAFPGEALILDISEVQDLQAFSTVRQSIQECLDIGASVLLDDFGSGQSSLTFLRECPINGVKLDGALIKEMERTPNTQPMIRKLIELLQVMNLQVVAEFVETEAMKATLTKFGCDRLQGYAIGPTLPASEVEAFLQDHARAAA